MKQVILVIGDSSGIGKDICELFNKDNFVYGVSRKEIVCNHTHYVGDVRDENRINEIVKDVYDKHNVIDLVVVASGMGISGATEQISSEDINAQIDINLKGVINVDKAVIPYMRKNNKGRIVHISSVAAIAPIPFQSLYSASKAALNNYSLALNNELRPFNIKVITVMPGDTQTGFTGARKKTDDKDNIYNGRVERSVSKMEKDETHGASSMSVAKSIVRISKKKHPRVLYTIGFTYKLLGFLIKILPINLVNKILYMMYAK
ncbi:MAG: SDR family NAD(P)-dependent oxidoreductase [Bacilli bacterium]|nr:SDR family NAD(P)-dependent oxidoreductase [Bacilli bacterium]